MLNENKISGLEKLGIFINDFIQKDEENKNKEIIKYIDEQLDIDII